MFKLEEVDGKVFLDGIERSIKKTHKSADYIEVNGLIVAKRCGCLTCNKMLPLDDYGSDRRGLGKKRGWCKQCDYKRQKMNKVGLDVYGNPKKKKPKDALRVFEGVVCVRKQCTYCNEVKQASEFFYHPKTIDGLTTLCKSCASDYYKNTYEERKESMREMRDLRKARKEALPDEVSAEEYREIFEGVFDGRCALTGEATELSVDHAIPFSVGHVGTTLYNVYPLSRRLNSSKFNVNIFEWVKRPHVAPLIDSQRFDKLIEFLAGQAGLSYEEYREFTYWCFDHIRDVSEIEAGGKVSSLSLWIESKNEHIYPI